MQAKQCNTDTEQVEGKKIEQKSQSTCGFLLAPDTPAAPALCGFAEKKSSVGQLQSFQEQGNNSRGSRSIADKEDEGSKGADQG